jgi:hypothetical protein
MMSRSTLKRIAALSAVAIATACGSGMLDVGHSTAPSGGGGGTNTSIGAAASYTGIVADSLKKGTVTITVSATLTVTGTMTFAGGPIVPLTGVVDTVQQELHASGGGFLVSAFTEQGTLAGIYGSGPQQGFLVATSDSVAGQTHKTYCGTYTSTNSNGRFIMQVQLGGAVAGFAIETSGHSTSSFFNATVINNSILTGATQAGTAFNGSVSADQSTISGSYAPPVTNATTPNTAIGTFTTTIGGC